ncbi:MAG: signal peptide peptidase SppA [Thermoflexibacter sp.]|jgi:protease-4|nr:signal peptide peptidase SppA [Thermoflexibacter sp.]
MWQFIKFTLAAIIGTIIGLGLLFFIMIGIFGMIASSSGTEEVSIEANSILHLNLNTAIKERVEENPFEDLDLPSELTMATGGIGLFDLKEAIKKAKTDDNIKGIYLEAGMIGAGFASLQEIREALIDFKKSKKFIYTNGDIYGENAYLLASVADKIFLNPQGVMEFNGLYSERMFYTKMFEKVGVKPEIFRVGEFKSAVEPYILDKMSPASRLQTESYLNSIYNFYLKSISESRNISVEELKNIANKMSIRNAGEMLQAKLITDTAYFDQVEAALKKASGIEEKSKTRLISLKKYMKVPNPNNKYNADKIAIIVGEGEIIDGNGGQDMIGGDKIAAEIRKARNDDKVKAIVLRINSPGGSALASDKMWREVILAKEKKPVIASMGDVAASGGYYMAMGCDKIIAQPNTITGSIGIFAMLFNAQDLLNNKIGLSFDGVKTSNFADIDGFYHRQLTEAEHQILQQSVNQGYEDFTSKAAKGRKMHIDSLKRVASGRVWTGEQAQGLGLVDELGNFDKAVEIAAKAAKLKEGEYGLKFYPQQQSFVDKILKTGEASLKEQSLRSELGEFYPLYKEIQRLKNMKGIQARIPYYEVIK